MKLGVKKLSFMFATLTAVSTLCGCASSYNKSRASGPTAEDKAVSEAVLKGLVYDPTYCYSHVSVTTADGTTVMSGYVKSWEAQDHAANVAMFTRGIQQIQNDIVQVR